MLCYNIGIDYLIAQKKYHQSMEFQFCLYFKFCWGNASPVACGTSWPWTCGCMEFSIYEGIPNSLNLEKNVSSHIQ